MCGKAFGSRDPVFVDDAQGAPVHLRGVVVLVERKCVPRIQPPVIEVAAVFSFANRDHNGTQPSRLPSELPHAGNAGHSNTPVNKLKQFVKFTTRKDRQSRDLEINRKSRAPGIEPGPRLLRIALVNGRKIKRVSLVEGSAR